MTHQAPIPRLRRRRWSAVAACLLVGWAGATGQAVLQAVPGAGPASVVRQFYRWPAAAQTDAACALRPVCDPTPVAESAPRAGRPAATSARPAAPRFPPRFPPGLPPAPLPVADLAAAATDPEQTIADDCAAHPSGDCATLGRLRAGYQHCGNLPQVESTGVERRLRAPQAGTAVLAFLASDVPCEPAAADPGEGLEGLAWLEQQAEGWRIREIDGVGRFADFRACLDPRLRQDTTGLSLPPLAPGAPRAGPAVLPTTPAPASRGIPADATPTLAPAPPPRLHGGACFSDAELRGSPAEAAIRGGPQARGNPPDPALVDRAAAMRGPWGEPFRGSIRWVDLADPEGRLLALTFDLCEQANEISGYDAAVVDWLREQRVPATFFAGGKWLQSHPERARQLLADPLFEVGNHAWTHGNLRVLTGEELREQVLWAQAEALAQRAALAAACPGVRTEPARPPTLFRFPYGTCGPEALDLLAELGLAAVQWDIVTGDPSRGQTAAGIVRAVRERLRPGRGHIVIMHANGRGRATAAALRQLVPALRDQGWRFVTVSDLLAAGTPHIVDECYELLPGDNARYDRLFGRGTGE